MKKLIIVLGACMLLATSFGDYAEELGGIVRKPGTGKGRITIINTQTNVSNESIQSALDLFNRFMHLPIAVVNGTLDGMPSKAKVKAMKSNLAIYVVKRPEMEDSLLVAPESHWAIVNTAALDDDEPTPDRFINRTQKEVVRAFGLLCGASNSEHKRTVMGPVDSYRDLDWILLINYPLDAYRRTIAYLNGFKVEPYVETTYQNACMKGWAPAPTNDIQKAIWDKVHQLPTQPIKILPETKKVKE